MPSAAAVAPEMPATRYPIKATVMTTGPGVIIATATASTNCRSVEPVMFLHYSAVEEWHHGQSAAEHKHPSLGEVEKNSEQAAGPCKGWRTKQPNRRPYSLDLCFCGHCFDQ